MYMYNCATLMSLIKNIVKVPIYIIIVIPVPIIRKMYGVWTLDYS